MSGILCFFLDPTGKHETIEHEHGTSHPPIYKRRDTGEEMTWHKAPVGAMRHCSWLENVEWNVEGGGKRFLPGPDGLILVVKCPNDSEWIIDSRASNCTKINDNVHRCWVRHGTPPNLTVDKQGNTCSAGGGSIQTQTWHGFLRNGYLVT